MSDLAFVFPGQGSQQVGMLQDAEAAVAATFSKASSVLGYDLWDLVQQGPEAKLNQTEFTQPALLTAAFALWQLAVEQGASLPNIVAGHSLGEYTALVAASVIEFEDAVSLVQERGQLMQNAVPVGVGGMAAILGLEEGQVRSICQNQTSLGVVQPANFNSPGQIVIAGENAALEAAMDACKSAGAKRAMPLAVSAPFHCSLMQPAADKMRSALASVTFKPPAIKVIQNVDADYCDSPDEIRENLVKQMYSAVLWTDTITKMSADGVSRVVECGPGRVLAGLNRRIDKSVTSFNINSLESVDSVSQELAA
jgi:[acyl-carrier-protein] S-malonyltransferase